jgi:hypothetical protein
MLGTFDESISLPVQTVTLVCARRSYTDGFLPADRRGTVRVGGGGG